MIPPADQYGRILEDTAAKLVVEASASSVPFLSPILTYAPTGRNCHERIQLLGCCAVPARDLTFRYLAARLNRLRKKSESRRFAASGAKALADVARLTRR